MNIVSLLPGATEIICRLGFKDNLVGRSHSCDYPEDITSVPVLTSPRYKMAPGQQDTANKDISGIVREGLGIYEINTEKLHSIQPDIIITQTQCDVCAVTREQVEEALQGITGNQPSIVNLEPASLDDIYKTIYKVGNALGVHNKARELVAEMHNRIDTIYDTVITKKDKLLLPYAGVLEWLDPLMTAGHWLPEVINRAGGKCKPGEMAGLPSQSISMKAFSEIDPDVIIAVPCGIPLSGIQEELQKVEANKEWSELKAVINKEVYLVDGNRFFNRPGPGLKESVEIAAEILHPDLFRRKWQHYGWIKAYE